ncbi:acyl-CoA N-acyltransferase [Myriangium duriaei CBS 260.36]|uniref:Acyl-CoA N-acyltransferase n=1 Tax=Myriangium duriaei CBS 260.36 TaxID=1168546 RepID=A0A9P4MFG2_9PEZI|nr:acyl-CoA N-acyltransferase [Myriangium duriaei CBS 260.36]
MPNTVCTSDRLIYRAVESDDDAVLLDMLSDPRDYANISASVPAPIGKKVGLQTRDRVQQQWSMAVIGCLKPEKSSTDTSSSAKDSDHAAGRSKLVPVVLVGLHPVPENMLHHSKADLGVMVMHEFQGRGYGSEAILWCLNWAFLHANYHRIQLNTYGWNTGAIRLYEKLGFVKEGCRREALWYQGRYCDGIEFGMLDREWRERYGQFDQADCNKIR